MITKLKFQNLNIKYKKILNTPKEKRKIRPKLTKNLKKEVINIYTLNFKIKILISKENKNWLKTFQGLNHQVYSNILHISILILAKMK